MDSEVTWQCPICKKYAQEVDEYLIHTCATNFIHINKQTLIDARNNFKK